MSRLVRLCLLCTLSMAVARCTGSKTEPTPLTVTSSAPSVTADGTSTVTITVAGATATVTLATPQGAWQDSGRASHSLPGSGSAVLTTCDSRTVANCGGSVRVSAAAENGATGTVLVNFIRLETCANSVDDDGDGKADCADTDCLDKTCLLPAGGVGTGVCTSAGTCICDTGVVEICNDGMDNNCNGKVDCADTTCGSQACKLPSGLDGVCKSTSCACPATAESCANYVDDDCNGLVDCADAACQPSGGNAGKVCDSARGLTCSAPAGGSSSCTVCAGLEALAEVTCNDNNDNDCDAKKDCADEGCDGQTCGANGYRCASLLCTCSGNGGAAQTQESTCNDGADNDCDGKVDCVDTDCAARVCGTNGKTCSGTSCVCTGNGGTTQTAETVCNDGADNDCDGLVDCAETFCRPSGNNPGKFCDGQGHTCSVPQNGVSNCTTCTVQLDGGVPQGVETLCFDNQDNDCDGFTDCQDTSCDARICSATGKICTALTCQCPGSAPETSCDDGKDNDCNGLVDCKDQGCQPFGGTSGRTCGPSGLLCTGTGTSATCTCSGNGGTIQTSEGTGGDAGVPTCGDRFDNDCDGYADCLDVNCRAVPLSDGGMIAGKDCSRPNDPVPTVGMKCDAAGQCICPTGQASEVSCSDGLDNDCDGLIDCQDSSCNSNNASCGNYGLRCNGTSCSCPTGSTENCSDFIDNDCNGKVDCADTDACTAGAQCDPSSVNYQCSAAGLCTDTSSNLSLQLTAVPSRIAANGLATATITATLKSGAMAQGGKTITFQVAAGSSGGVNPASGNTNVQGQTNTLYTASSVGGRQTITGTYDTGTQQVVGSVVIDTPTLGQVKFVSQQYSIMGVKFSSYQESNDIVFQVLDNTGVPYPSGLAVNFSHAPVGGSFIGPTPACSTTLCTYTGTTDANGLVKVTLHSGTVASVVSVIAEASAGGVPGQATASNIAIVGAKASGSNIAIDCDPRNVPAFFDEDCTNSYVSATVTCTVRLGDRFQNVLKVSTQTTFSTEAGLAGQPQLTNDTGAATGTVAVGNAKLPVNVDPIAGEWSLSYDSGCGTKIHNPRDGLVTIIGSANGEEGFVDGSNGQPANGVYDPGENFIDIGEPYVDANDNGGRDQNETYLDSNNNGSWDGPNGIWDSTKVIWAETRILYTGHAAITYETATGNYVHSRWYAGLPPPSSGPTAPPTFSVLSSQAEGGPSIQNFNVYFADKNFNQLNAQTTYSVSAISGGVQVKYNLSPNVVDNLGMNFTQQFCEPTGANCSNTCQAAPCRVFTSVGSFAYGNYGVVEIKGGSQSGGAEVRAEAKYGNVSVGLSIFGVVLE